MPGGTDEDLEGDTGRSNSPLSLGDDSQQRRFVWTDSVMQQFREELEKLVILDYIMRNTDRGLDNWMIKCEWPENSFTPSKNGSPGGNAIPTHVSGGLNPLSSRPESPGYQLSEPMVATPRAATPTDTVLPRLKIGAIDNSLAFPWKHPDQWRSFPFG